MVFLRLVVSIRGLFRRVRRRVRLASCRRNVVASDLQGFRMMDDDRVSQPSLMLSNVAERERGERTSDRPGFMIAARTSAAQPMVSRTTSSKRKLEELEIGVAESSGAANSQVRARRENRDEVFDGSIAESSGRERYEEGMCASGEAQALDGETLMRDEGGNEAIDADAMWDEDGGWNKTVDSKVIPDEKVESTGGLEVISEDNSLAPPLVSLPVISSSLLPSLGVVSFGEALASDSGSSGEVVEEGSVIGFTESSKETELGGLWSTDRERESPVFNHEEELAIRRNLTATLGTGPENGGSLSSNLSSFVSSNTPGTSKCGNGSELSSNQSHPMVVDTPTTPCRLQFFVRTYIDGRTVVLQANASDSIESVHQQIFAKTGLPVSEQRLIFGGRQLRYDQTLDSCRVGNDATLNLVARMRSTSFPRSWQLINDLVMTIRSMSAASPLAPQALFLHSQDSVRAGVQEFLKVSTKSGPVEEHMQVFQLAGATSALVMLLLSPVESNRECAEESITCFLVPNDEFFPPHVHCHCAPLLLEFCKLLGKSAPNHSLYTSCRNALARLLDSVGVAHGSPYFNDAKADTVVHDFSPFVNDLSLRLTSKLRWIASTYSIQENSTSFTNYVKEAKDFTAFVIPLCKAMEACKGFDAFSGKCQETPGLRYPNANFGQSVLRPDVATAEPGCDDLTGETLAAEDLDGGLITTRGVGVNIGSHSWLLTVFRDLLADINKCLGAVGYVDGKNMGDGPFETPNQANTPIEDRERPLGWAPLLVVLKGLHAIAKLYESAMEEFLVVLNRRRTALNVLIRQSRCQLDDFWLLEHKSLLDFESKRRLVMAMLPEPQDDHDERQEMVVHRSQLLSESFETLAYVEAEVLQGGISVEFSSEEATGPGVLREWFSMICREIFNCQNALFLPCPKDRRRFFPNPASGVNPGHLTYFRFCGRVIALALMHKVQVDVVFALTFFKQLSGLPISWEDAKDADPTLYESCKKILEVDAEIIDSDALGLTFVSEVEELGKRKVLELCQGGKDMVVTSENRQQFVELLVQRRLVSSVTEQIKSFSQGFTDLLVNTNHQQFLRALNPEDLDLLLYGEDRNICLNDWKMHTEYHDYASTDDQIVWFWEVVESMTPEQRRRLLFFSTSVTHLPAEGFAGLSSRFHIHRAHTNTSWLPTAHTCFYQLVLPSYSSKKMMFDRLHTITEVHIAEGFGFA